jgi:hypothetical protein
LMLQQLQNNQLQQNLPENAAAHAVGHRDRRATL